LEKAPAEDPPISTLDTVPGRSDAAALNRNALWMLAANVATLAVGYAGAAILARALGPSARGVLAVLQYGAVLGVGVLGLGNAAAVAYFGSRRVRHRPALAGNTLVHAALLSALALVAAAAAGGWLSDFYAGRGERYPSLVWYAAALLVPLTLLDYFSSSLLAAHGRFRSINRLTIAGRAVTLLAAIVVLRSGGGLAGAIGAGAAAQLVMVAGGLRIAARDGIRVSARLARACAAYGARAQVGALLQVVNARFDVVVLQALAPLAVVGQYAVAQIVAELVLVAPRSVGAVLTPTVAAGRGDAVSPGALRLNGTLSLAGVAAVGLGGPLLIAVGYGHAYLPALGPFLVLLPATWFLCAAQVVNAALRGRGRPGAASLLALVEVALTITLDLLLIPPYGALGAAVASAIAYVAYGVASIVAIARLDGVPARSLLVASRAELAPLGRAARRLVGR
jgi:O-antigen/teichoic acid export membrane protein